VRTSRDLGLTAYGVGAMMAPGPHKPAQGLHSATGPRRRRRCDGDGSHTSLRRGFILRRRVALPGPRRAQATQACAGASSCDTSLYEKWRERCTEPHKPARGLHLATCTTAAAPARMRALTSLREGFISRRVPPPPHRRGCVPSQACARASSRDVYHRRRTGADASLTSLREGFISRPRVAPPHGRGRARRPHKPARGLHLATTEPGLDDHRVASTPASTPAARATAPTVITTPHPGPLVPPTSPRHLAASSA
jgi:hypothetical protein